MTKVNLLVGSANHMNNQTDKTQTGSNYKSQISLVLSAVSEFVFNVEKSNNIADHKLTHRVTYLQASFNVASLF